MAKEIYFSSQVCEQLARELVTEQAEMLKHEALVKEIKAKLVEGKQQLIRKLIVGKEFVIEGEKLVALNVCFDVWNDSMRVVISMGYNPFDIDMPSGLSKKEKELFYEYRDGFICCVDGIGVDGGYDALCAANKLTCLKHGIILVTEYAWDIDFSNATTPGFFEQSGLQMHDSNGYYMLEDLECC